MSTDKRKTNVTRGVLPLVVFPALVALAARCIFAGGLNKELDSLINAQCAPGAPLRITYTGLEGLDARLVCPIVSMFHGALEPSSRNYTIYLAFTLAPIVVFMYVEATRAGRSRVLSAPAATAFGLLYQLLSAGAVLPLYWAAFLLSGQAARPGRVDSAHAQATAFAFGVGFFIPTTLMLAWADPVVTALWQPFPLWMLLAQRFHLLVRPPSRAGAGADASGKQIVQALYWFTCLVATWSHLTLLWPIRDDLGAVRQAVFPRFLGADETLTLADGARNFLQWDGVFIVLPALLATLWFARSGQELVFLALWNVSTSITMGPGAALATVYAWREATLD